MVTDTLNTKKAKAVSKPTSKPVAATTTTIETVSSEDKISAMAAVLPDSLAEYDSDSDKDWDISCHDVSLPICGKHLV